MPLGVLGVGVCVVLTGQEELCKPLGVLGVGVGVVLTSQEELCKPLGVLGVDVCVILTGQEELCCEGLAGGAAREPLTPVAALVCRPYLGEVQRPVAVHHVSEIHPHAHQLNGTVYGCLHSILIPVS